MVRKLAGFGVLAFAVALAGCGASVEEIKPDANAGGKLDATKAEEAMKQSMEKMPPQMQAKMKQQMEQMKKMQEGAPK
ncbi:MAG: hypothetical protein U0939_24595 [Pirellulales bacterium]